MLNAAKPLPSAGDSLYFAEDIYNALFLYSGLAFRFFTHDPVKTLILVLACGTDRLPGERTITKSPYTMNCP